MKVSVFTRTTNRAAAMLLLSVFCLTTIQLQATSDAQIASWVNANNGFYEGAHNWVPDVPETTDTAVFGVPGSGHYQIGFLADHSVAGLLVGNNVDISFALGGNSPGARTYQVNGDASVESAMLGLVGSFELQAETMNLDENAELSIEDGAQLAASMTYGFGDIGVTGTSQDGMPSTWNSDSAFITRGANLNILDGAQASHDNVFVAISDFSEISVGGNDPTGNPSSWNTGNLSSGLFDGKARFHFSDGASITSDTAFFRGDSVAYVSGTSGNDMPTSWDVAEEIMLEGIANDVAAIVIEDSGTVSSAEAMIVQSAGIIIDGPSSSWNNRGNLYIGGTATEGMGVGNVSIWNDAEVNIGGTATIWRDGNIFLNGGRLIADTIEDTAGGSFSLQAGTLQVKQYEGDLANDGGIMMPGGTGTDTTSVLGHYTQGSGAAIVIDIMGREPGNYDVLNVASTAFLSGSLQINISAEFSPSAEDAFTVMAASALNGTFDNVENGQRMLTADGQGSFVVNYGPESPFEENEVVVSSFMPNDVLLGDVNRDGQVNLLDVAPFVDALANALFIPEADVNQDGQVDLQDVTPFVELLSDF